MIREREKQQEMLSKCERTREAAKWQAEAEWADTKKGLAGIGIVTMGTSVGGAVLGGAVGGPMGAAIGATVGTAIGGVASLFSATLVCGD